MNTTYNYKNETNNMMINKDFSKKGTAQSISIDRENNADTVDKLLSVIDNITDLISSMRFLVVAKALFAFIALLGFLGVIGGIELGTVSLISGSIALALIIGVEFLILKD